MPDQFHLQAVKKQRVVKTYGKLNHFWHLIKVLIMGERPQLKDTAAGLTMTVAGVQPARSWVK